MVTIAAEAMPLEQLLQLGRFEPARVQREYQWTDRQCSQLVNDLVKALKDAGLDPDPAEISFDTGDNHSDPLDAPLEKMDESASAEPVSLRSNARKKSARPSIYYLGPIILLPAPSAKNKYYIYDGQQRMTSLMLLLAVLRDAPESRPDDWLELINVLRTETGEARLQVKTAGRSVTNVISSLRGSLQIGSAANKSESDSRVADAVAVFARLTHRWSDNKRRALVKFLREKVWVTVTKIDNSSLAHRMFVSANDRGLSLKMSDVIKGHFINLISEQKGSRAADSASRKWDELRSSCGEEFDQFLKCVDFLEFGEPRSTDFGEDLIESMEEDSERALTWLQDTAPRFRDNFLRLISYKQRRGNVRDIDLSLYRMSHLGWKEWQPVAILLMDRYATQSDNQLTAIRKLERAAFVAHLAGWHQLDELRCRNFAKAVDQLKRHKDPFRQFAEPGEYGGLSFNQRVKEAAHGALYNPMPMNGHYRPIVLWIETLHWGAESPAYYPEKPTVEHVLPKAAMPDWSPGFLTAADMERCKHMLGNMCVVPYSLNKKMDRLQFPEKQPMLLSADPIWKSAQQVAEYTDWGTAQVEERTSAIASKAARALYLTQVPRG